MSSFFARFLAWFLKGTEPKVVKKKRYESIYPDPWQEYLFKPQPEATIRDWARRLQLFRYLRAYGGMSNDADELMVVFLYQNMDELIGFFRFAGIPFVQHQEEPAQSYPGRTVQDKSLIRGTKWTEQIGHCEIAGQKVFVWCTEDQIRIGISDTKAWTVYEAEVVRAEIVEKLLKDAPLPRLEPPRDDKHCICPKYYPEYFQ